MPAWVAKDDLLRQQIEDAKARAEAKRLSNLEQWKAFVPAKGITPVVEAEALPTALPSELEVEHQEEISQNMWQPRLQSEPIYPEANTIVPRLPVQTAIAIPQPVETREVTKVGEVKDYTKELDILHPFKIDEKLPLWAKTLSFIGKPFEIVQEFLFDPVLGLVHQPWAEKTLTSQELSQAKSEGIASYFPGGIRHKAYEQLQYPGKFVVELLPWLIVPPIGTVGIAGAGGRGIAGALSKVGKIGELAGRTLEYSPAGLTEKAVGGVVGAITGKVAKTIPTVVKATEDPLVAKVTGIIRSAETKVPEQKLMTHELRVQQLKNAMPELQMNTGEKGLRNFMSALRGEAEKVDFDNVAKKLSQTERNNLADMIRTSGKLQGFEYARATSGWQKILEGKLPVDSELEELQKVFGSDLVQALIEKKPENIINKISDIANAPRAVLSAVDLSGTLRQGMILSARYPTKSAKTVIPMIKSFFSDANAELVDTVIRARPHTAILEQYGTYLAPLPSRYSTLSKMEESFMSKWIANVPIIGAAVKASNRAYVTGLNDLRSRVGETILDTWEKAGVTIAERDYTALGKLINAASGRGSLPRALAGASPLFNAMLFSPRLFISRLQFPAMLASESPLVRKEAARMLVQFLGAGTSFLGMAHVLGANIEIDPRSADFAKLKVGNTRLDIWSGYAQWVRFVAQLVTEQRKTAGGNISELNRLEVVNRFLQSKFSPGAGLLLDVLRGESYAGEEVSLETTNLQRQAYTRLMPLFIQDMIDAVDQEGLAGGMVALPGLFGIGVVTYMSPAQKLREKLTQDKYGMSWEQLGKTQGLAAQMDLERSSPELLAEIQKEREDYDKTITGKTDLNNIYRNQTETIEKEYRRRVNLATEEYRDTGDGYTYKEKILELASNRRSQYDVLNKDPQFAKIVARYNEQPTSTDLTRMSPQDWARKEYMRMMYSDDMYDEYGNYRFEMVDDVKALFIQTFGQSMLDYVETYQGTKESDMPAEYLEWKQAQKTLKPYWGVADKVTKMFGLRFAESNRGQALITKERQRLRRQNPAMDKVYRMFYTQVT